MYIQTNAEELHLPFEKFPVKTGNNQITKKAGSLRKNIILSERDYEVLAFILDMKFASVQEVYEKFFKNFDIDGNEFGFFYAKKRLVHLEQCGFLKSTKEFFNSKRLFFGTMRSYIILSNLYPDKVLVRPQGSIDGRTIFHDYLLLGLRLQLESSKKITSWLSDRKLRCFPELAGGLTGGYVPDGIYTMPDGTNIAFELEIALKGKDKYREKVRKYICLLNSSREVKPFSKVHFVYAKNIVGEHLNRETKLYPEHFTIEPLSNFISPKTNINLTRKG